MFVLFPAGAPSVSCIDISQPLTRDDVSSRSGMKCGNLVFLEARMGAVRKAMLCGYDTDISVGYVQ